MEALAHLIDDHDQLIALADRLLGTVAEPIALPEEAHAQLRDLASQIERHVRIEKQVLDLARRSGTLQLMPLEAQHGDRFRILVCDWIAYLDAWPADRVRREWNVFSRHTLDILRRVKEQIESENTAARMLSGFSALET
jgi:hypothetical protein